MASFISLPNELLESAVEHLLNRKIDKFDSVATQDLQNVRLVCRTLHTITTPMLFEDMILDFHLWEPGDNGMRRLVTFAERHPQLAKLVQCLQLRIPPTISHFQVDYRWFTDDSLQYEINYHGWTSEQVSVIHDKLVIPLHHWQDAEHKAKRSNKSAIRDTTLGLPNLRHVEQALSTHYRRFFGEVLSEVMDKIGHDLQYPRFLHDTSSHYFAIRSMYEAFAWVFKSIAESFPNSITSLKLRNVASCQYYPFNSQGVSATLQHMDLELRNLCYSYRHSRSYGNPFLETWRCNLIPLVRLKTLCLSFEDGEGRTTDYAHSVNPKYIDSLLIDPTDNSKVSIFPHLELLALTNCSLGIGALLTFAAAQSSTLKSLELRRVTFDPSFCPGSWSEVAATCKSALPNLTHLRMAKLITHFARQADAPMEGNSTPERWNRGLEGATAYEWLKGTHGSDVEVKGSRCPWEPEDIIVEEDCKRNFNGDRYWFYTEKEKALRA